MRFIILIIVLLIAATAGYFTLQVAGGPSPSQKVVTQQEPKVEAVSVLVAREAIPVGTIITEEMLDKQPWPKHLLLDGFVLSGSPDDNLVGMVARSDFQAQEPIIKSKLANPNDANFIAAALPAGMRALTLEVDAISGVAGYIFPGDRVDVVLTHNIPQDVAGVRTSNLKAEYAESLLTDVLVLAVDVRPAVASKTGQQPQKEGKAPTNLTIAVSSEDVQKIRIAEKNGSLSLALRSLKDKEDASKAAPTSVDSITGAPVDSDSDSVIIIRGVTATESRLPSAMSSGAMPFPPGAMPSQIIMSAPPVAPPAPPPSN
jgi:pilus assembly protein CpaB